MSSTPLRNRFSVRQVALTILLASGTVFFVSCTAQDEETRKTSEAGGTIPWNRPAGWEGGGALGSQMQQMQGQSGANF